MQRGRLLALRLSEGLDCSFCNGFYQVHDSRDCPSLRQIDQRFKVILLARNRRRCTGKLFKFPLVSMQSGKSTLGVLQYASRSILRLKQTHSCRREKLFIPSRDNELRVAVDAALSDVLVGHWSCDYAGIRKQELAACGKQSRDIHEELGAVAQVENHVQRNNGIKRAAPNGSGSFRSASWTENNDSIPSSAARVRPTRRADGLSSSPVPWHRALETMKASGPQGPQPRSRKRLAAVSPSRRMSPRNSSAAHPGVLPNIFAIRLAPKLPHQRRVEITVERLVAVCE